MKTVQLTDEQAAGLKNLLEQKQNEIRDLVRPDTSNAEVATLKYGYDLCAGIHAELVKSKVFCPRCLQLIQCISWVEKHESRTESCPQCHEPMQHCQC